MVVEEKTPSTVMTLEELAEYLQVPAMTIYDFVQRDTLPAFKLGNDWRFSLEAVESWLLDRAEMLQER